MSNSFVLLMITILTRLLQVVRLMKPVLKGEISYYPAAVKRLEKKFSFRVGSDHALMFSNATSAIEAALFALDIGTSSRVGTTAFVIPSSYCSASSLGASIEFLDIDPATLNLDHELLIRDSTKQLSALIVTHFYGNPCDMECIMAWANETGVLVIEDCSHAHGASFKGRPLGSWGHIGVFSLQGAKAVAAGEGAIAVTNQSHLALQMAAYGHQERYKRFNFAFTDQAQALPPFGFGRKMRAHPLGAVIAEVDLQFLPLKNRTFSTWVEELEALSRAVGGFLIPKVSKDAKRGGYCAGVPLIFDGKGRADEFERSARSARLNYSRRDYRESIEYFSGLGFASDQNVMAGIPHSLNAFGTVVLVSFRQFIFPLKWRRLIKVLRNTSQTGASQA